MNGFPLVSRVMCVTFFHKKSQVSSFASPPEAKQPTSSSRNFVAQNRFFFLLFKEHNIRNKHAGIKIGDRDLSFKTSANFLDL